MSQSIQQETPDALVGQTIDGRYTIERPLASGGMGSVYIARQRNLARPVAIKVVTGADPELVERFRREADALADVSHPAIVEVHDFIQEPGDAGRCYLVMTYVEGQDLEDYLDELPQERVQVAEAVSLILPVVSALVQLHAAGIVHRDIKPANIIRFQGADNRPAVKLVDFGIARRSVDPGLTNAGFIIGTPPYMAPETLMAEPHTPVADVYAVGATLFELLTGGAPFGNGRLHEIMGRALKDPVPLPEWLRGTPLGSLLLEVLDKDVARRPDALRLLEALERVQDELAAARVASGSSLVVPAPAAATATRPADRGLATVALTPRPGTGAAAQAPRGTAMTHLEPPGEQRRRWLWLGPLIVVPVVIAIVTLTLVLGGGNGKKASAGGSADDSAAMSRPQGEGAVARRPQTRRVNPRRREGGQPARDEDLGKACKTHADAARYFKVAKAAARVRTRDSQDKALRYFRGVLRCAHSYPGERRWAARLMANVYLNRRACRPARAMWKTYQKLSWSAGKRAKQFPGCR